MVIFQKKTLPICKVLVLTLESQREKVVLLLSSSHIELPLESVLGWFSALVQIPYVATVRDELRNIRSLASA